MDFKSIFDGLDKVTDILNVGRLIFYTTAGFSAVLPVSMCLRILAVQDQSLKPYWARFLDDSRTCAHHVEVWLVALVFGFIVAALAYSLVMEKSLLPPKSDKSDIDENSFEYNYPRLFSGGVPDKQQSATKDYAAWLISEYYRYLEIVIFIPYGILLSIPVYSLYSLIYLIQATDQAHGFAFGAAHLAFALWTLAAVIGWGILWPKWVHRVAYPAYKSWRTARLNTIEGLRKFVDESKNSAKVK